MRAQPTDGACARFARSGTLRTSEPSTSTSTVKRLRISAAVHTRELHTYLRQTLAPLSLEFRSDHLEWPALRICVREKYDAIASDYGVDAGGVRARVAEVRAALRFNKPLARVTFPSAAPGA